MVVAVSVGVVVVPLAMGRDAAGPHQPDRPLERFELDRRPAVAEREVEALALSPLETVTGKSDSKSPLNVETDTDALAVGGTASVMSPLWLERL